MNEQDLHQGWRLPPHAACNDSLDPEEHLEPLRQLTETMCHLCHSVNAAYQLNMTQNIAMEKNPSNN